MVKFAVLTRLEARPGKEEEVEKFLKRALPLAQEEKDTVEWFAFRIGQFTFGIFDTFYHEEGREYHLNGKIAKAFREHADELLSATPIVEKIELLASKEL